MVDYRDDHTYTSDDERMVITVDFDDSEERELTIWYKTRDENEKQLIFNELSDFVDEVLDMYEVSIMDANLIDSEEEADDDGMADHFEFPPSELDETLYDDDGEEIEDPDEVR